MRIYHPKHGILFTTDQTEINRLISEGGTEFDVNNKPWIKKESIARAEETEEEIAPKRGRPAKTWQ